MVAILSYFKIKAQNKSMVESEPEELYQQQERQIEDVDEEK